MFETLPKVDSMPAKQQPNSLSSLLSSCFQKDSKVPFPQQKN